MDGRRGVSRLQCETQEVPETLREKGGSRLSTLRRKRIWLVDTVRFFIIVGL